MAGFYGECIGSHVSATELLTLHIQRLRVSAFCGYLEDGQVAWNAMVDSLKYGYRFGILWRELDPYPLSGYEIMQYVS